MLLLLLYIIRYKIQKNLQKKAPKGIKKTDANGINKLKNKKTVPYILKMKTFFKNQQMKMLKTCEKRKNYYHCSIHLIRSK